MSEKMRAATEHALCVAGEPAGSWKRLFDLRLPPLSRALPAQLRVTSYALPLPTGGGDVIEFGCAADADAASQQHFLGFAAYLALSKSAGQPRAAVVSLRSAGGGGAGAAPPAPLSGDIIHVLPALSPSGAVDPSPTIASRLRLLLPPLVPATCAGGSAEGGDAAPARKRSRADFESAHERGAGSAAGGVPTPRLAGGGGGEASTGGGEGGEGGATAAARASAFRYIVYPDYVPEKLAAPLERRAGAAHGAWQALVRWQDRDAGGFWRTLEAAVESNEWDFVSKPAILFCPRGARAHDFVFPPTLHSLPPPMPLRPQLLNHMPNARALSSKAALWRALSTWYAARGVDPAAGGVPTTFVVAGPRSEAFELFRARFELLEAAAGAAVGSGAAGDDAVGLRAAAALLRASGERMPARHCTRNMWIVKPEKLMGGQGIELLASVGEVRALLERVAAEGLRTAEGGRVEKQADWIVQKYVERPLLLAGRKFDVRINALVTSDWDVYVYRDGFCRTTSVAYSCAAAAEGAATVAAAAAAAADAASSFSGAARALGAAPLFSKSAHVTNHCYQVSSGAFGAHEPSNILSLDQLQSYLDAALGAGALSVHGALWPRWAELILNLLSATRASCVAGPPSRRHWFELVGVDFLLDESGRSWLIEANTSPGVEGHCPYADAVFGRMLEEMAQRTLDARFPLARAPAPPPPAWLADSALAALPWKAPPPFLGLPRDLEPRSRDASGGASGGAAAASGASPSLRHAAAGGGGECAPRPANRWELVWSERASESDLRAIPHQAAMAPHACNAAAVAAVLAAEAAVGGSDGEQSAASGGAALASPPPLSDALALRLADEHGLGAALRCARDVGRAEMERIAVAHAAERAQKAAGGETAAAAAASAAAAAASRVASEHPLYWRPMLRRFIRREDESWLYPLGVPPDGAL